MYTIGEFSKIAHVSPRMLRYYETLDLIHPADVGQENSYRYYDVSQLNNIFEIQKLQRYGIKLKEIPELLIKGSEERMDSLKQTHHDLLKQQEELILKIRLLENEIYKLEDKQMEDKQVILLNNPKQWVFGIKRTINITESEVQNLFSDLYAMLTEKGIHRNGPAQLVYLSNEFSHENMEVEAQVQVSEDTPLAHCMPPCQCISTLYHGPHDMLHTAYEAMGKWMSEHPQYHLCGPVIERFIVDDHEHHNFETGLLFPVVQISK